MSDEKKLSPAQLLHQAGFARLQQQLANEQAAEQRATGGRRAGGVPRRAISEQEEAGRRADEVIPPARGKAE